MTTEPITVPPAECIAGHTDVALTVAASTRGEGEPTLHVVLREGGPYAQCWVTVRELRAALDQIAPREDAQEVGEIWTEMNDAVNRQADRAERAEAEVQRLAEVVARVEALADELASVIGSPEPSAWAHWCADRLRAALSGPTPAETPQNGPEPALSREQGTSGQSKPTCGGCGATWPDLHVYHPGPGGALCVKCGWTPDDGTPTAEAASKAEGQSGTGQALGGAEKPCRGQNANVCVAEGCFGEACVRRQAMSHDERDVETVAEALHVLAYYPYVDGAHPDHNHWTWRGDGPSEATREEFRAEARAVLDALDLPGRERRAKAEALREAADARPEWQATLNAEDDQHFIAGSAHGAGPDVACDVFEAWLTDRAAELDPEGADDE